MSDQIDRDKIVGVAGVMGPEATVDFMAAVIAFPPAETDQDHVHMIVDNDSTISAQQDAILGDGETPARCWGRVAFLVVLTGYRL